MKRSGIEVQHVSNVPSFRHPSSIFSQNLHRIGKRKPDNKNQFFSVASCVFGALPKREKSDSIVQGFKIMMEKCFEEGDMEKLKVAIAE